MSPEEVPSFGERRADRTYRPRPGAYIVATDAEGRVAILETGKGCFLPGGGLDPGESHPEALRREVREECGCEVEIV